MHLILEEQFNNVHIGEVSNFEDLKHQMKYVTQKEQLQNEQFNAARYAQVFGVFQLDIELGMLGEEQPSQAHDQEKEIWTKMKSKIKVDRDLKFDKTKQLWELLE